MRFKKGELDLYKSHSPKEIEELYKTVTTRKEAILYFVEKYEYNFVTKKWKKR